MENPITLRFRYTEEDYVQAMRAHYYRQLCKPLDLTIVVVTFAAGVNLWALAGLHWLGVACVAIVAIYLLMLALAYFFIPQRLFRSDPKFRDEYNLDFSSAGIHFRTASIDSQLQWSLYSRALISEHTYNLYYGTRGITVIPKRVLANAQQQADFEKLLAEKISAISRRR